MYDANFLIQNLAAARSKDGSAPFLRDLDGGTTSHAVFFANAERMAAALVRLGLKPGDRVAVQAPKTPAFLELYIGVIMAGGVFLPLNTAYTPREVEYFLRDATPRVLVCDPDQLDVLSPVAHQSGVEEVMTLGADGCGSLVAACAPEAEGVGPVRRGNEDLAAILYTSGTTGRSKGAMLSHGALVSNARVLADVWRFRSDDVLIHALPVFHTHGLFVATNTALMSGASCLFMAGFDAEAIIRAMPGASVLMGVPTYYTRLLAHPGLRKAAADMRLFVSGSAPLLAETHDLWRAKTGHAILERYGMTETNMNSSNPYDGERRAGTVGPPLPGVEIRITDPDDGTLRSAGQVGMIEVRGPNVFSGYWQMPEKTQEELRENGYFITGDLGRIDADGYLHIVGRAKDLIITGGYNVYPKEIELLIDALPGVEESAVIGAPHPDFGEAVVALVVPRAGPELLVENVRNALEEHLAGFKRPKRIIVVDALPRNTMGKVQKNILRYQHGHLFRN